MIDDMEYGTQEAENGKLFEADDDVEMTNLDSICVSLELETHFR